MANAPLPNESALAQLKDIHLPDPISWWPLAKGWFVLALGISVFLLWLIYWGLRYIWNGRSKRQALRVLAAYQADYVKSRQSQLSCARISELLKRVALVYYPRAQVASLQGQRWIDFLNETAEHADFNQVSVLLTECPYQPSEGHDVTPLFHLAKLWIKQRRGRCLK
jgi:hypothetical protein